MKKLVLFAFSLILVGCTQTSDGWVGFFYPSGSTEDDVKIQEFASEQACTEWAAPLMDSAVNKDAHYFCGFECQYDNSGQYSCSN